MGKTGLTDEQVEQEIQRLLQSEAVKLARRYEAYQYRRRNYLYTLRQKEKIGLRLMEQGIDLQAIEDMMEEDA